ncbi:MAG TPA: SUF system NifU family Fe-S cluster assembly protein [Clostridiales bacterium]|nr:SUF system NifU family Fe-S cluster assembly protein [Clostridiales bacterium]
MPINSFYNEILTDHNIHPGHKFNLADANLALEGVNPSCGDDIVLQLKVSAQGVIEDGSFNGDGCAISQASADMMLDLIIGKTKEEALHLSDLFLRMIKGEISEEEAEELEEASSLKDISHMPSRVKCAVLGWHTMEELLQKEPGTAASKEGSPVTTE